MNRLLAPIILATALVAQNPGISLAATVDGYVEVPYSAQIVPPGGITVEAWITYDDGTLPTGWRYPTILRQGISVGGSENYMLRVNADNNGSRVLRWAVKDINGAARIVDWTFGTGQLLTWTHVAATYDGATLALYIDGVQVGSTAGTGLPIRDINSEVLRIGKGSDVATPIEVWNGELDEVRLWPFARSAAEIAQTKDFWLASVPGLVSTWNFDGHPLDTSGGQHATLAGAVTYTTTGPALTQLPLPSGIAVGAATAGCGALAITFGSLPQAGNAAFAPVCSGAPAGAVTFLGLAFGTAATPTQVAGVDVWLDPASTLLVLASTDGLGTSRFSVPIPLWLSPGQVLAFQYGYADPCGPLGVTASAALETLTQ